MGNLIKLAESQTCTSITLGKWGWGAGGVKKRKQELLPFLSFPSFPVSRNHLLQLVGWKLSDVLPKEKIPLKCRGMDVSGAQVYSPLTLLLHWEEARHWKEGGGWRMKEKPTLACDDKSWSLIKHCWGVPCSCPASKQIRFSSQSLFFISVSTVIDLYKNGF